MLEYAALVLLVAGMAATLGWNLAMAIVLTLIDRIL